MKPAVDISGYLKQVVQGMTADLLPILQAVNPNIQTLNYQSGSLLEVVQSLMALNLTQAGQFRKYPLIWLNPDFDKAFTPSRGRVTATLQILIAYQSNTNYTRPEREAKSFLPIIYPVANALVGAVRQSREFTIPNTGDIKMEDKGNLSIAGPNGGASHMANECWDATEVRIPVRVGNLSCGQSSNKLIF